jgi:hypothetical protein
MFLLPAVCARPGRTIASLRACALASASRSALRKQRWGTEIRQCVRTHRRRDRISGQSSTPRRLGSITAVSGYWVARSPGPAANARRSTCVRRIVRRMQVMRCDDPAEEWRNDIDMVGLHRLGRAELNHRHFGAQAEDTGHFTGAARSPRGEPCSGEIRTGARIAGIDLFAFWSPPLQTSGGSSTERRDRIRKRVCVSARCR